MMLEIDETTEVMLSALVEHDRNEPVEPDPMRHTEHELSLHARRRDEWERERSGLFQVVAARLAHKAVYEYPDAV